MISVAITDEMQALSGIGTWEWSVIDATATWSLQARRIFEVEPDAVLTPDDLPRFRPESSADREAETGVLRAALRFGTPWDIEHPAVTATGRRILVRSTGHADRVDGRTVRIYGIIQDVTEARRAAAELQRRERLLADISRKSGIGGWEIELATSQVRWSDETRRIYEVDEDFEPTMQDHPRFVVPEWRETSRDAVRKTIIEGVSTELDFEVITAAGRRRWVRNTCHAERVNGRTVRIVGTAQDITEERDAAIRVDALNTRLSAAINAAGLRIWEVDPETREMTWDARTTPSPGLPADAPPRNEFEAMRYFHVDDVDPFQAAMRAVVEEAQPMQSRYRIVTPSGEIQHVEFRVQMYEPSAGVRRVLGVTRDVTQDVELNRQLELKREEAEAASIARGVFVARMSHEIRTPMNGVIGMLEVLNRTEPDPQRKEHSTIALKSARDLMHVLDDVIDVSRLETRRLDIEIEPFQVDELVHDVVALFGPRAQEKGLALEVRFGTTAPPWLAGDSRRIKQVLINLVGNAIKFTDAGCVAINVDYLPSSQKLRVDVCDTGIGIRKEIADKLFQQFFQADDSTTRRHGGSGLGLTICKQLVELMGGEIGVTSQGEHGSIFWFTLQAPPAGSPASRDIEIGAIPVRPLRILIAEDNHSTQRILEALLGGHGHSLTIVNDGQSAVAMAASGDFDLILMDVMMPVMDGPAAARRIRGLGGRSSGVPIIALTANALAGDRDRYLAAGMTDYLSKPIDVTALLEAIARAAQAI